MLGLVAARVDGRRRVRFSRGRRLRMRRRVLPGVLCRALLHRRCSRARRRRGRRVADLRDLDHCAAVARALETSDGAVNRILLTVRRRQQALLPHRRSEEVPRAKARDDVCLARRRAVPRLGGKGGNGLRGHEQRRRTCQQHDEQKQRERKATTKTHLILELVAQHLKRGSEAL